jgi:hypothetical protein
MRVQFRILALGSIVLLAFGPALNAQEKKTTPTKTAGKARHCVSNSAEPTRIMCYDNFTAAIAAATGGRISDAPADVQKAMKDRRLMEKLNATKEKRTVRRLPTQRVQS